MNSKDDFERYSSLYYYQLYKSAYAHKKFIYGAITTIVILGALVPFAAQFILPFFFPECKIAGAEIWNQYVSIVLGVVATLMSIISLKLSFDNMTQSFESERRTRELFAKLEGHLIDIEHNQNNLLTKTDIMSLLKNGYHFEEENDIISQWNSPKATSKSESNDI
ncbi:MAG: hypothetical protein E7260_09590 [Lachnospiraceae bacterium]|nr:hypothetical protein [Lachnospiraceae bacterium]